MDRLRLGGLVHMSRSDAAREGSDAQTSLELILVALEHIEAQGSLLLFAPDHERRARLMKLMTEIELVDGIQWPRSMN